MDGERGGLLTGIYNELTCFYAGKGNVRSNGCGFKFVCRTDTQI